MLRQPIHGQNNFTNIRHTRIVIVEIIHDSYVKIFRHLI